MSLNFNNEITKKSREINFEEFNKTICNDEHFKVSQRNLIMMYIFLYDFFIKNKTDFNEYLNRTTYFNKIIFLKYLNFFRNLNKLEKRILDEINNTILELEEDIETLEDQIDTLLEEYDTNRTTIEKKVKRKEKMETQLVKFQEKKLNIETNFENIKDEFIVKTTDILKENNENLNTDSIIKTLFDENIINNIYNEIIEYINEKNPASFNAYMTLFHLNNQPINVSSNKAIFYIGIHGTLCVVVPNNTYLTIASPVNTTINRWGERGEAIKYFNTMDYTFKQCLLTYGEDLTNDNAEKCFNLLGASKEEFNMSTKQITTTYCQPEPDNYSDNYFSNLTGFDKNEKMRIKHYSVDSYNFMIFNTDYTIPDELFENLSYIIPGLNNTQYNTAENIINLNFLLFTNNINFTIFNLLNIADETGISRVGLYPDIGLFAKYYLKQGNTELQSDLHNFSFPLDIFSFNPKLFTEDFTLEREIYALNNIYIHLKYQDVDRSFVLLKGDSFSSNPYIIEYFIRTFNSKITIRPGPILGNKEDEIFKQNKQEPTNSEHGSTITCLSKGLSCYKVTLSMLTNYEILQLCKDANINTCDLYDTSCQSFEYLSNYGEIIENYTPPPPQKQTLQRMNTKDDSTMLAKYDNLSDIFFTNFTETPRDFLVVGVENSKKTKRGGKTQKCINKKKNSYKQRKNSYKQRKNSRKQKKNSSKQTKKIYK
jgi:hypothetical protein